MTLPEIIREALRLMRIRGDHVDVARAGEHAYQVRFIPSATIRLQKGPARDYRTEGRRWMDGSERTPTKGTESAYVGWAHWSTFLGFSVDAVLADDWRIL